MALCFCWHKRGIWTLSKLRQGHHAQKVMVLESFHNFINDNNPQDVLFSKCLFMEEKHFKSFHSYCDSLFVCQLIYSWSNLPFFGLIQPLRVWCVILCWEWMHNYFGMISFFFIIISVQFTSFWDKCNFLCILSFWHLYSIIGSEQVRFVFRRHITFSSYSNSLMFFFHLESCQILFLVSSFLVYRRETLS